MNIEAFKGRAKGAFAFQSSGYVNAGKHDTRPLRHAGSRYADFRAKQQSGMGIPPPERK